MGLLLLVLNLIFGSSDRRPVAWPGPGPVVLSPSAAPVGSPTGLAEPEPTAVPPTLPSTPPEPTPEPTPEPAVADERPQLTVLNHSRISGLAKKAAADFTRGGWEVVEVGNTRYAVAVTTVFFLPGQEGAAAALREQFPAIRRSAPRPAELPGAGLTVVVTREYPR
ncbi:MAG TPA: LytR C-terminal domain-containing protein [Mycobacteriales bacterium]|nr:LytR C-terminal domain-containing protein [Mycobacteriales bacterium]